MPVPDQIREAVAATVAELLVNEDEEGTSGQGGSGARGRTCRSARQSMCATDGPLKKRS